MEKPVLRAEDKTTAQMETYIVLIQTVHSVFYPKDGEGSFHQNVDIGPPK